MTRDRSAAAVARAFLSKWRHVPDAVEESEAQACIHCVAQVAALVRAVRRECLAVVSRSNGYYDALDNLRALNRAPRRGR